MDIILFCGRRVDRKAGSQVETMRVIDIRNKTVKDKNIDGDYLCVGHWSTGRHVDTEPGWNYNGF